MILSLPSCLIWSASRPSHSPKTSLVCCPSSGDGLTSGVRPPKRTGQPGILKAPAAGCCIVCMMPRCSKSGSSLSSIVSKTAPAGTPASPRMRIASRLSCWRVQAAIISSTAGSCSNRAAEARIADQILASDDFEQSLPMRRIGAAGINIDVVIRSAGFARINAARHRKAGYDLGAVALCRHALGRLRGKRDADILQHGVLHGDLDAFALTGAATTIEGRQNADGKQHTGAGIAERHAGFDRGPVVLAGDAHDAACRLRDHVEGEIVLVGSARAEAL